jgi:hypothetical protein
MQTVQLIDDQTLVIEHHDGCNLLTIAGPRGGISLSIRLTERGAELEIGGEGLAVRTSGDLSINARRLSLHGRDGVALSTGGDVSIEAGGDMRSKARGHRITADPGDVEVRANDDVKLDGERIRMNC